MRKLFIVILLLLTIFSSLSTVTAHAEVNNEAKTVVAFGDSITYGYTVDGNSYAKIYCDEKGYTLNNYAQVGMTSIQLLELLETDLDYSRATEILLWIGANDLLQTVTNFASEKGIDYNNITYEDVKLIKSIASSSEFRTVMQSAVDSFAVNLENILNTIKQKNSGKIFVFTQYNPYSGVNIVMPSTGESLNLGLIAEEWIEKLNTVITKQKNVEIVDTFFSIEESEEKCVNAEINVLTNTFEFDPHLNLTGHKVVYQSLLKSLAIKKEIPHNSQSNLLFVFLPIIGGISLLFVVLFVIVRIRKKLAK